MKFSTCYHVVALVPAALLWLLPLRVQADDLPKFSDSEVNNFVNQYADFVGKYIEAYKAAKTGNASAFDQLKTQVQPLQNKVSTVADKLKSNPAEVQKYEEFIATYTEKMIDATK
jgi:peptidoglycan hydrolase CwlO-like protein